jgi:ABC-type multidrug transport system ATPase subunit
MALIETHDVTKTYKMSRPGVLYTWRSGLRCWRCRFVVEPANLEASGFKKGDLCNVCHGASVQALRGVSLAIEKGEYVAIMGPSGSGKSTLMHIIGCLDRPSTGRYILNGKDVAKLGKGTLARVRGRESATFSATSSCPCSTPDSGGRSGRRARKRHSSVSASAIA